jgi:hypothetical protein
MPVTIAEIDRQLRAMRFQMFFQRGDQGAILRVDGADPAKVIIVRCHFFQSFTRMLRPSATFCKNGMTSSIASVAK